MALSKPRPILQDMPLHIKDRIAKNLDSNFDKMILRNSHPDFRRVTGNPKIKFSLLRLYFCSKPVPMVKLMVNGNSGYNEIEYKSVKDGTEMSKEGPCPSGVMKFSTTVVFVPEKYGNFIDLMAEALACFLDNPNFEIGWFIICADSMLPSMAFDELHWQEFLSKVDRVLRNLKHKVKADNLSIDCFGKQDDLLKILPYVDTSSLRVNSLMEGQLDGVDKLISHWGNVDKLIMFDLPDNKFPIEQWWDFPKTQMTLWHTSLEDIKRLVQHFRSSSTFVECELYTELQPEELMKALDKNRYFETNADGLRSSTFVALPATETMNKVFAVLDESGLVKIVRSFPM